MTMLLQGYAARQAERRPEATAIVGDGELLTYGELEARSNRLARMLLEAGCRRGDRVGLFVPKSPAAIVAMHAVMKADCAYVPIDLESPAARVGRIVESADLRLILAASGATSLLDDLVEAGTIGGEMAIGSVEEASLAGERFSSTFSAVDWSQCSDAPVASTNGEQDLAHLLFTSGSTGQPKGVMITHANVTAFVDWATAYFGRSERDRLSGHPPLHFDLSTFDIYSSFAAGAELHLVPASTNMRPRELAAFIRESELTQWFSVPSVMALLTRFKAVEDGDFPHLEHVLWCGEVLPTPVLIDWMRRLPHARFTNLYGPTEATIASSYYRVPRCPADESETIPIGTPCDGEQLAVLDDDRRPVAPGEIGDLYISGVGLSPGYWRDEERTREAFIDDPRAGRLYRTGDLARIDDEGLVVFLGRADSQIKSRGHRIELGEIETALNGLPEIAECAVVGVELGGFEGTTICCAYALHEAGALGPPALRERMRSVLPPYMLPSRWAELEALPKNLNGKIDRPRLRELFKDQAESRKAREPAQEPA